MAARPKFHANERVDLLDLLKVVTFAADDAYQSIADIIKYGDPKGIILSGFTVDANGTNNGVVVTLSGSMFLNEKRDGTEYKGRVYRDEYSGGSVELLAPQFTPPAGTGTYDLYIRAVYDPSNAQNRAFWDTTAGAEVSQLVYTEDRPTFELSAVLTGASAPWPEGVKIAEVTANAGVITSADVTDKRQLLFEGHVDTNYDPDWGSGSDRNSDRTTYGIKDLYTFAQFVRRQIRDILGASSFKPWTPVSGNVPSLENLSSEHWEEDSTYEGNHKNIVVIDGTDQPHIRLQSFTGDYVELQRYGSGRARLYRAGSASAYIQVGIDGGGSPRNSIILGSTSDLGFTDKDIIAATGSSSPDGRIEFVGGASDDERSISMYTNNVLQMKLDNSYGIQGRTYRTFSERMFRRYLSSRAAVAYSDGNGAWASGNPSIPHMRYATWPSFAGLSDDVWYRLVPSGAFTIYKPVSVDVTAWYIGNSSIVYDVSWMKDTYRLTDGVTPYNVQLAYRTDSLWEDAAGSGVGQIAVALVRRYQIAVHVFQYEIVAYAIFDLPQAAGVGFEYPEVLSKSWDYVYAGTIMDPTLMGMTMELQVFAHASGASHQFNDGSVCIYGVSLELGEIVLSEGS